jgi:hypothetical protein
MSYSVVAEVEEVATTEGKTGNLLGRSGAAVAAEEGAREAVGTGVRCSLISLALL